jgi:hypothetical protein
MVPTPFAVLVILAGLFSSGQQMPRALMLCCLFGGSAAIALPALGGAPVTPAILLLPFLLWRALQEQGLHACTQQLAYPRAGFWLLLLAIWGLLSAYFVPRLFDGASLLYATDRGVVNAILLLPLQPRSTNITQSAYAVAAVATFVALGALLEPAGRMARFRDAVLLLASVNIGAALLNLAELHLAIPSLLGYVRNAGYAILVGGEVGGLQRISGTFAEASLFASFSLPLFAFSAVLWRERVRPRWSGIVALVTLLLLMLSTSSTAHAGLTAYLSLVALGLAWRSLSRVQALRLGLGAWLLWTLAVVTCVLLLLRPELATTLGDYFRITVMRKLESSSGIERSSWNMQAWINFLDLYGLGVGLGSARASSFPLVLLSNVGVLGTLLFLAFLVQVLRPSKATPSEAEPVARAARHAVLAALIAATISATVFDLGVAFYAFAAAAAMRAPQPEPRPANPYRVRGAHAAS